MITKIELAWHNFFPTSYNWKKRKIFKFCWCLSISFSSFGFISSICCTFFLCIFYISLTNSCSNRNSPNIYCAELLFFFFFSFSFWGPAFDTNQTSPSLQVSSPLNSKFSHSFPLSSLANECASHYGNDLIDRFTDEAGNYFALATILSSSKVWVINDNSFYCFSA